jgi:lysozyme family protein
MSEPSEWAKAEARELFDESFIHDVGCDALPERGGQACDCWIGEKIAAAEAALEEAAQRERHACYEIANLQNEGTIAASLYRGWSRAKELIVARIAARGEMRT